VFAIAIDGEQGLVGQDIEQAWRTAASPVQITHRTRPEYAFATVAGNTQPVRQVIGHLLPIQPAQPVMEGDPLQ